MTWRLLVRDIRFHPLIWILSILGVAVGVSGWIGMQLATHRAFSSFQRSLSATVGEARYIVEDQTGRLEEETFFRMARRTEWELSPVLEGYGRLVTRSESASSPMVKVVGIDPVTYGQVRTRFGTSEDRGPPLGVLLAGKPVIVAHPGLVEELNVGDTLALTTRGRTHSYQVGHLLEMDQPGQRTLYMDIGRMQRDFQRQGWIDRILIRSDVPVRRIQDLLGPSERVTPAGQSTRTVQSLLMSFRLNLRALAFMALFVGAFLVYAAMLLYTRRLQQTLSLLRTLGMTSGELLWMSVGSIVVLGVFGSFLGLLLGNILAAPLGQGITGTVDRLYVPLFSRGTEATWTTYLWGLGMGLGVSILGGAGPLWKNRHVPPRQWSVSSSESGDTFPSILLLVTSTLLCLIGAVALVWGTDRSLLAGFASCFLISLGGALGTMLLIPLAAKVRPRFLWIRFALRNLRRYGGRVSVILGALVVAFSLVLAVSIMVSSFRVTVEGWVDRLFQADFYVQTAPEEVIRAAPDMEKQFVRDIRRIPGVRAVSTLARRDVLITGNQTISLRGVRSDIWRRNRPFQLLDSVPDPWKRLEQGAIFLSEPGSFRMGVSAGDTITLPVQGGPGATVTVAGIFQDYSTNWALAYMDQKQMLSLYPEATVQDAAVFVESDASVGSVEQALRSITDRYGYWMQSNQSLREDALAQFDRTFAVTRVMQAVAGIVAVVGLIVTLMSFHRARRRLFGLLTASGSTRAQVARMIGWEGAAIGCYTLLGSIPTGFLLGYLLIYVVNRRSFGWLIDFHFQPGELLEVAVLVALSLLVSLVWPVVSVYREELSELLHEQEG